jgi:hypothetical protein
MYGFQLQVNFKVLEMYNRDVEKPFRPKDVAVVVRASRDTKVGETFKGIIDDLPVFLHVGWSKKDEPILLHEKDLEMTWGECEKLQRFRREKTSGDLKVIYVGLWESELPDLHRNLLVDAIRRMKKSKFYRQKRRLEKALIEVFGNDEVEEDSSATRKRKGPSSPRKRKEPRSPRKRPKPSPAHTDIPPPRESEPRSPKTKPSPIPPPHERVRSEYNGLPLWPSNDKRNKTGYKGVAPQKLNGLHTGKFVARWVGGDGEQYQLATTPTALEAAYAYAINMLIEHEQTFRPASFTKDEKQQFAKDLLKMKRYKNFR